VDGGLDSFWSDGRMKKIVAIDARMVLSVPHGIGRYVKNLAVGLSELAQSQELPYEPVFLTDRRFPGLLPSRFTAVPVRSAFLKPAEILELPRILKSLRASLYHSPSFSSLAYSPCPWIATVHDLNHLHFGDLSKKAYYHLLLRRFAKNAEALLTVSEFAKQELSQWLPYPADQIEVVMNALDPDFSAPLKNQIPFKEKWPGVRSGEYFVCLSNAKPHKNLPLLVRGYLQAREQSKNLPLLVLSADRSELGFDLPGESGVVFTSKLNDQDAKMILLHARAAFFPSLYEGFGLPPLEAIMSGVPVVVSNIPPHREGLQDFAHPFIRWSNSSKPEEWVQAFVQWNELPTPSSLRESETFLAARQKAQERFSVQRLASHMDQIYRRVLSRVIVSL
jgi:glycosyltransferase involved in cell wall biosynthesis